MQTMQFYNENKTSALTQRSTVTMVFLSLPPHLRSAIGEPNLQMEDRDQVKHLTQAPLNICMNLNVNCLYSVLWKVCLLRQLFSSQQVWIKPTDEL